jgi:hypothetical protein
MRHSNFIQSARANIHGDQIVVLDGGHMFTGKP